MATCCQSNSTFLIFAVLVGDVGRVAVKHCFKLLSFLHSHVTVIDIQALFYSNLTLSRLT